MQSAVVQEAAHLAPCLRPPAGADAHSLSYFRAAEVGEDDVRRQRDVGRRLGADGRHHSR